MTSETVAAIAGIILSLLFSYFPGLHAWFESKPSTTKRLIMLALLLVATAGILANQCRADGACYGANWELAVSVFIAAVVANQAAYLISPELPA